jgi:hypothetical protein
VSENDEMEKTLRPAEEEVIGESELNQTVLRNGKYWGGWVILELQMIH